MQKRHWFACMTLFLCAAACTAVWAETRKPAAKSAPAAATEDKKLQAAYAEKADVFLHLVTYGEAEKDPVMLLSAVKVLDDLPFASLATKDEKGKDAKVYDRDEILKQARSFAEGDAELLAVIAKVQDAPVRTEVRGQGGRDRSGRYDGRFHDSRYNGGHFYYERRIHERRFERRLERYWHPGHRRWYWR